MCTKPIIIHKTSKMKTREVPTHAQNLHPCNERLWSWTDHHSHMPIGVGFLLSKSVQAIFHAA